MNDDDPFFWEQLWDASAELRFPPYFRVLFDVSTETLMKKTHKHQVPSSLLI